MNTAYSIGKNILEYNKAHSSITFARDGKECSKKCSKEWTSVFNPLKDENSDPDLVTLVIQNSKDGKHMALGPKINRILCPTARYNRTSPPNNQVRKTIGGIESQTERFKFRQLPKNMEIRKKNQSSELIEIYVDRKNHSNDIKMKSSNDSFESISISPYRKWEKSPIDSQVCEITNKTVGVPWRLQKDKPIDSKTINIKSTKGCSNKKKSTSLGRSKELVHTFNENNDDVQKDLKNTNRKFVPSGIGDSSKKKSKHNSQKLRQKDKCIETQPIWKPAGSVKVPLTGSTTSLNQKNQLSRWFEGKSRVTSFADHTKSSSNRHAYPLEPIFCKKAIDYVKEQDYYVTGTNKTIQGTNSMPKIVDHDNCSTVSSMVKKVNTIFTERKTKLNEKSQMKDLEERKTDVADCLRLLAMRRKAEQSQKQKVTNTEIRREFDTSSEEETLPIPDKKFFENNESGLGSSSTSWKTHESKICENSSVQQTKNYVFSRIKEPSKERVMSVDMLKKLFLSQGFHLDEDSSNEKDKTSRERIEIILEQNVDSNIDPGSFTSRSWYSPKSKTWKSDDMTVLKNNAGSLYSRSSSIYTRSEGSLEKNHKSQTTKNEEKIKLHNCQLNFSTCSFMSFDSKFDEEIEDTSIKNHIKESRVNSSRSTIDDTDSCSSGYSLIPRPRNPEGSDEILGQGIECFQIAEERAQNFFKALQIYKEHLIDTEYKVQNNQITKDELVPREESYDSINKEVTNAIEFILKQTEINTSKRKMKELELSNSILKYLEESDIESLENTEHLITTRQRILPYIYALLCTVVFFSLQWTIECNNSLN